MNEHRSKIQCRREDPNSGFWLKAADREFYRIWHSMPRHCRICGHPAEGAHMVSRENYLFRWDPMNIFEICADHHRNDPDLSHHKARNNFLAWLLENHPLVHQYIELHQNIICRKIEMPFTFQEAAEIMRDITDINAWWVRYNTLTIKFYARRGLVEAAQKIIQEGA